MGVRGDRDLRLGHVETVKSKIVCKLPAAPSYAASISSLCRLAMAASPAALFSSSITAGL